MNPLLDAIRRNLLDPNTHVGAMVWAVVPIGLATAFAAVILRPALEMESRLPDGGTPLPRRIRS